MSSANLSYREVLDRFDGYLEYSDTFSDKLTSYKNDLNFKYLEKIPNINNYIIKKFEEYANIEEVGKPLHYIKKMTLFRIAWFIGALAFMTLFYIGIISSPFGLIDSVSKGDWWAVIIIPIGVVFVYGAFYLLLLTNLTYKIKDSNLPDIGEKIIEGDIFKSQNRKLLKLILFPFNQITTSILSIHFIIGDKGFFIYSEMNTGEQLQTISYKEKGIPYKIWKIFNKNEKDIIQKLSKKSKTNNQE